MNKYVLFFLFFFIYSYAASFVLFTQPKTGTHLLIPILQELSGKGVYWAKEYLMDGEKRNFEEAFSDPNYFFFKVGEIAWPRQMMETVWEKNERGRTFLHLHAPYSPTMESYLMEKSCVNFFIKRDPRDQIVSLLNHYKHIQFNNEEIKSLPDDDERLLRLIRKKSRSHTSLFMPWMNSPACCVLDFDKLMGSNGGVYSDREALEEMKKIADALQLHLSEKKLLNIYRRHFGHGWNFFRGKAGAWKEYFKEIHKIAMKEEAGDLLIELGYEKDFQW